METFKRISAALALSALAAMAFAPDRARAAGPDSTNAWGYGYDSLLRDLGQWRKSPYVKIDSIGASVQGRALWMVSISDSSDSLGRPGDPSSRKRRVFFHARTHPAEVQAQYVSNEAIRFLLDSGSQSRELRRGFIFNIVPMYNPDGVQLGHDRLNAHLVNLENNWDDLVLEPEAMALKRQFEAFMAGPLPIEVALNLHSDQGFCTRFFFFHYAAGTSAAYEDLERKYIAGVQRHFPGGIRDWTFQRSWDKGTKAEYPEGFWWLAFRENVLALTYEDTNCGNAGLFDSTGRALALGSADYIRDRLAAGVRLASHGETRVLLSAEGVRLAALAYPVRWDVADLRGRRLAGGTVGPGDALLSWSGFPEAPVRLLSISAPGMPVRRLLLPFRPR